MPLVSSRRAFLETAAAVAAGTLAAPDVHAADGDLLRVGLIGCGGRGTGGAAPALKADRNVKLVALADAFEDRLRGSLAAFEKDPEVAARVDVKPERCFVGFDG